MFFIFVKAGLFRVGETVEALYRNGNRYYGGVIAAVNENGTYCVNYEFGGEEAVVLQRSLRSIKVSILMIVQEMCSALMMVCSCRSAAALTQRSLSVIVMTAATAARILAAAVRILTIVVVLVMIQMIAVKVVVAVTKTAMLIVMRRYDFCYLDYDYYDCIICI